LKIAVAGNSDLQLLVLSFQPVTGIVCFRPVEVETWKHKHFLHARCQTDSVKAVRCYTIVGIIIIIIIIIYTTTKTTSEFRNVSVT